MCQVKCAPPQPEPQRLQLSHHVEDGHDQDEGGGRHGEDQSQPGVVGDDGAGGRGEPGQRAEGAFSSLLSTAKTTTARIIIITIKIKKKT